MSMGLPLRPLFIGLPGAGKTTVSRNLADRFGYEITGTDPLFRIFRAIGSDSEDPRAIVMRRFLERARTAFPDQAASLAVDAKTLDAKGRCALHDSAHFRAYGEDVFRLCEICMLQYLHETGAFANNIVDLSASAPLYPENRQLFAPQNGYAVILIQTPVEKIVRNVAADYARYLKQSEAAGEKKPIRGAYEKKIDDALMAACNVGQDARQEVIFETARAITKQEWDRRMQAYEAFAQRVLIPADGDTPEAMADQAIAMIHAIAKDAGC